MLIFSAYLKIMG